MCCDLNDVPVRFAAIQRQAYDPAMNTNLKNLPLDERIRLVEDLWDSIASEQKSLSLTADQKAELDKRLQAFELDGNSGRLASDVIKDIRSRL